jgi:hypothetical protein
MEIWRKIEGFEYYEVSNLGMIKSLKFGKEKILKPGKNRGGYFTVNLSKDKIPKCKTIHQLVAIAFLNHKPCGLNLVVDHKNDDKTDNKVENLQIVTQRFNTRKTQGKYSSKYKGVCLNKALNKWISTIRINGKNIHLGLFNTELEASETYQNKLAEI